MATSTFTQLLCSVIFCFFSDHVLVFLRYLMMTGGSHKWINTCLVLLCICTRVQAKQKEKKDYFFWVCVWLYSKSLSSSNFWLLVCGWPLGNFLVSGPVPLDWFFCWRKYYIETAGQKRSQGEGLLDQGKFLVPSHHSCMTTECSYFFSFFLFFFLFFCVCVFFGIIIIKKSVCYDDQCLLGQL